jgi:hypothetical protein
LNLIDTQHFHEKIKRFLKTFRFLKLYNDELPNREYQTTDAKPVDLKGNVSGKGSGWSAIDIGRMLVWLKIVSNWYPEYEQTVKDIVNSWDFRRAVTERQLYGVMLAGGKERLRQEGRLGYEQYAARGFSQWKMNVSGALDFKEIDYTTIMEKKIPFDIRNHAFLTSEPFFLAKMETFATDPVFSELVETIYEVQKQRWADTGILTAVSEDSVNRPPWFVYNCILFNRSPWVCVSNRGKPHPFLKNLSTKAVASWACLFDDDYSNLLFSKLPLLIDEQSEFLAGRFENGKPNTAKNVNTNAVILEAMLYVKNRRQPFMAVD